MVSKQLERLRRISSCLDHVDKIHLREIARLLEVSEMTIRRDINSTAAAKFNLESYGGFVRKSIEETCSDVVLKPVKQNNEPEEISLCHIAAKQVNSDDMVFFDNSDYSNEIISSIDKSVTFTGVTFSLTTFLELKTKPNCNAVLLGGNYDPTADIFKSETLPSWFESMVFTKLFITPDGVHQDLGVTFKDSYCSSMFNEVMKRSIAKYLICPKTIVGNVASYSISFTHFDYVITSESPSQLVDALALNKVALILEQD
ncbi:DeoR family transcriptional regulator [Vibrio alfacsensis]|uniref:DeoR family transcriptional regulator n=1 Tax=Vibrio alfacsensis TaxID=1074311 RepID=UPI001BEE1887|nr:DeoR family transcriptional regulator [Vibrio alfacsensis]BCN26486.1 DeoR family transcriptional regulator [Vibrio alfacsensis]